MTIPYAPDRVRLRDKRAARRTRSIVASEQLWAKRIAKAQTPLELFDAYFDLAKTRITQRLRKADRAVARAKVRDTKIKSRTRATALRAKMITDVTPVIDRMYELAMRYDGHLSPASRKLSEALWASRIAEAGGAPLELLKVTRRLMRTRLVQAMEADETGGVTKEIAGELGKLTATLTELAVKYYKPRN